MAADASRTSWTVEWVLGIGSKGPFFQTPNLYVGLGRALMSPDPTHVQFQCLPKTCLESPLVPPGPPLEP